MDFVANCLWTRSKNFLFVAPGIIVYERLLDAFLGKVQEDGTRNPDTSDFKQFEELFLPESYKEDILGFIQNNVVQKKEIGRKVTGDGLIAITNWHLLAGEEEIEEEQKAACHKSLEKFTNICKENTSGSNNKSNIDLKTHDNDDKETRRIEINGTK